MLKVDVRLLKRNLRIKHKQGNWRALHVKNNLLNCTFYWDKPPIIDQPLPPRRALRPAGGAGRLRITWPARLRDSSGTGDSNRRPSRPEVRLPAEEPLLQRLRGCDRRTRQNTAVLRLWNSWEARSTETSRGAACAHICDARGPVHVRIKRVFTTTPCCCSYNSGISQKCRVCPIKPSGRVP